MLQAQACMGENRTAYRIVVEDNIKLDLKMG
jgi:hypothetical protein